MMKTKKKFIVLAAIVAILILLIIWIAYGNTDLEIYKYNVKSGEGSHMISFTPFKSCFLQPMALEGSKGKQSLFLDTSVGRLPGQGL